MEQSYYYLSRSPEETKAFANRLGKLLLPGDVLALEGDLGAGKTTFSQGLARGLGVDEQIDSPTFTICKEYVGRIPFYHMDVYRLSGPEDSLDLDEYLDGDGVCLVEWASRIEEILPEETVWISIGILEDGTRELVIAQRNGRSKELSKELQMK
ncbi:tRNA (adenosine(37)-N6)-threonylcarbamoyltransferase complex ATPase subunit type 1 TsaE [Risungbinella massiliensis]|uniref:tRNA (adenosine(37)-N6)-threonylcarbamoyltransferase complex ATPase subunit type 1 TsaE n=1 Tax=Risungbinella massiliensis TaxID=1329796 RepID=UPI0005CC44B2|nr:tRNA (adenosine(37)-N6)-threonylcarbamoyltransferase complex ATPase subunit type 1 TsaE [Risungbinella massiliensis]